MLKQVHLLLSYTCILKCDHCFVCSGPTAEGTFALSRINEVLDQAKTAGTVDTIYFEGGEPFLFYPLLIEGIRQARNRGFSVGIVTNGFFATSRENARLFLDPVAELGIADISISDDAFHYENRWTTRPSAHLRLHGRWVSPHRFSPRNPSHRRNRIDPMKDRETFPTAASCSGAVPQAH